MSDDINAPFQTGWLSLRLGKYRPGNGTYNRFSYENLPPLAESDDALESLAWLGPLEDDAVDSKNVTPPDHGADNDLYVFRNGPEARRAVAELADAASERGLTLPPSFMKLMSLPWFVQARLFNSPTACYFQLGETLDETLIALPGAEGVYVIPFLHDSQGSPVWCLYLAPGGGQCVLAGNGDIAYLGNFDLENPNNRERVSKIVNNAVAVAPSFASFLYRWNLENNLWFKLYVKQSMSRTPAEQAYLNHYTQHPEPEGV